MNYKLEKFWNGVKDKAGQELYEMNYKLEKFWNSRNSEVSPNTINEL